SIFVVTLPPPTRPTLLPYTTLFRSKFIHADAIPVGGNHVTLDLAKGLSTSISAAERLKVMHGSALPGSADDRDLVSIQPIGDERSEEHTSELQSRENLVCRLLLEKK